MSFVSGYAYAKPTAMLKLIYALTVVRNFMQCIGATTLDEYRKHIEKDPALERRFQPDETIQILKGLRERYEIHHKLRYTDVQLSHLNVLLPFRQALESVFNRHRPLLPPLILVLLVTVIALFNPFLLSPRRSPPLSQSSQGSYLPNPVTSIYSLLELSGFEPFWDQVISHFLEVSFSLLLFLLCGNASFIFIAMDILTCFCTYLIILIHI
ncbi:ATP-dependent Clp protease ATP-binding subunit ClpA, chloroplastic [Glycine soja]